MLGTALEAMLKSENFDVIKCGRNINDDVFLDLKKSKDITLNDDIKVDAIFHCASSFSDNSSRGSFHNELTNSTSSFVVAELASKTSAKSLIYAGTMFSEKRSTGEISSYGLSKRRGEELLSYILEKSNQQFCSLRFPQLIDEEGKCVKHQPWFGRVIKYASSNQVLRLPREKGVRNFMHVDDAAKFMFLAMLRNLEGVHPICHPEDHTYQEVFHLAKKIFKTKATLKIAMEKRPFTQEPFKKTLEIFCRLGYRPASSLKDILNLIDSQSTADKFGSFDVF